MSEKIFLIILAELDSIASHEYSRERLLAYAADLVRLADQAIERVPQREEEIQLTLARSQDLIINAIARDV